MKQEAQRPESEHSADRPETITYSNQDSSLNTMIRDTITKKLWVCLQISSALFCGILLFLNTVALRQGIQIVETTNIFSSTEWLTATITAIATTSYLIGSLGFRHTFTKWIIPSQFSAILIGIATLTTIKTGGIYDYSSYKSQWQHIVSGGSPWDEIQGAGVNAYGPIHNLFAGLYAVNELGPKFVYTSLAVLIYFILSKRDKSHSGLAALCIFGPFCFSTIFAYGFIDVIPATTICLSAILAKHKHYDISALSLAVGTGTKFYPAALLPALLIYAWKTDGFKYALKSATWFLAAGTAIGVASYGLWGEEVLSPLRFAGTRDPSFLTLWRVVDGHFPADLSKTTTIGLYLLTIFCQVFSRVEISCAYGGTLSLLFGAYHLGHQQFYIAIVMLIPEIARAARLTHSQLQLGELSPPILQLRLSCAMSLAWFTALQLFFVLMGELKPIELHTLVDAISAINTFILLFSGGLLFTPWLVLGVQRQVANFSPGKNLD